MVVEAGGRHEVWGSLSCPEVARQCLLHDDALELVDAPRDAVARWTPSRVLGAGRPYERYLDDVRATAMEVLSLRAYPTATRLFLLAYLGQQTSAFFHRDVAAVDEERLGAAIAQIEAPETIALWHRELGALPAPRAMTANLVAQLLRGQAALEAGSLRALIEGALGSYRASGGLVAGADGQLTVAAAALWEDYAAPATGVAGGRGRAARALLRELRQELLDARVVHDARSICRPTRAGCWCGSPSCASCCSGTRRSRRRARSGDAGARQEALDCAAVEAFYKLSRAVEHQGSFLDRIAATVLAQGLETLAHSTFLILV